MSIRFLPRVVAATAARPDRAGAAATQARSRALAADPSRWTPEQARDTVATYETLAPTWNEERGAYRPVPLRDALARGGALPAGSCVEVGSGTGLLTPLLAEVWAHVVNIDLSAAMLARSPTAWRVRADAARLPVRSGVAAAVVLADAPLFAAEIRRVLRDDGIVIWSNALGDAAPHHVPVEDVVRSLSTPDEPWSAVAADAGWGCWAVLRRDRPEDLQRSDPQDRAPNTRVAP